MPRSAFRAAVAAAALLVAGPPVPGYLVRRTGTGAEISWNLAAPAANVVAGKVTFFVDATGVPDVTPQEFADAVRAAIGSWEAIPHSSIAFAEDPARPAAERNASDRIDRIGYTPGVLGGLTFGAAYVLSSGDRILDADIVLNPSMEWAVQSPGNPSRADVQAVTAHEWGHAIGLDHVPAAASTMYFATVPGAVSLRSLETDDAAAAADLYPAPALDEEFATVRGRVDVAGTSDDRGVQVTAISFATGRPAASNLSLPDGAFEIRGLPSGAYYLVASPLGTQRVDAGTYVPYWDSSSTQVVPAVRGQGGAADGTAGVVLLDAGQVVEGLDLALSTAADPGEPDGSAMAARPLAYGRSATGRIENGNDRDFFSFAGGAGDRVTVLLHARQIGSDLDPRIYLRDPSSLLLGISQDISTGETEPGGADRDCRFTEVLLPSTGTYTVEVEAEISPDLERPEDFFYVITLLAAGGPASPYASGFTASPPVAPADGVSSVLLSFTPRTDRGTSIDAGSAVTFALVPDGDPDGTLDPVALDGGSGTWTATLTAPSAGGGDAVRALVDGVPVSMVAVAWRGPADFDASPFGATPRRLRADGESQSEVVLVPRDAQGIPLGAGRTVALSLDGAPDAALGATADRGDGSYAATLTAGGVREELAVSALVDGDDLGGTLPVGIGFPLGPVLADSVADIGAALSAQPPPAKAAAKKLAAAEALLVAAAAIPPEETLAVVGKVRAALRQLEAAERKGTPTDGTARELAEAGRQAALDAFALAFPLADTPAEVRAVAKAMLLLDAAEPLLDAGLWSKAAAKFRASIRQSGKVR